MSCNKCKQESCGCENSCPILDVDTMPDSVSILRFNINGVSSWYDFGNMIYQTQTDTKISADTLNRVLKYMAERHTDTISAKELGSILHIADLGDVDISGVTNNSLFVYQKKSDCAHGCEGIDNSWIAWNAKDHLNDNMETVMGFDSEDRPVSLRAPANTNQYYTLGWNADRKVGYHQPQERQLNTLVKNIDGDNYAYRAYIDPETFELCYVREKVTV